jgi:hypothetical protein
MLWNFCINCTNLSLHPGKIKWFIWLIIFIITLNILNDQYIYTYLTEACNEEKVKKMILHYSVVLLFGGLAAYIILIILKVGYHSSTHMSKDLQYIYLIRGQIIKKLKEERNRYEKLTQEEQKNAAKRADEKLINNPFDIK